MKCNNCPGPCLPNCLLGRVSYCSYCASYGHFTINCSNHTKRAPILKEPKTYTEWPTGPRQVSICKSEKSVRAFLYFYKLSVCQKMETNVRNINKFCRENGWARPIFIEPAENVDSEEDEN